jgi:sulfur-oxidizing protein SoxY
MQYFEYVSREINMNLTRRVLVAGAAIGFALPAFAQKKNNVDELIAKFTGGKAPVAGKVKIDAPEIAENGNTVPVTVSVDSPMSAASHCQELLVVCDGNPQGGILKIAFLPEISVPEANFRMRMAETQNVIAIAKMSDGTFVSAQKQVKVTIGGCGG